MKTKIIINEEKQVVTAVTNVRRKLVKDARRYNIDVYNFPTEVAGVAYVRDVDVFDPVIGQRVAVAKAEKEYLNNLLNTKDVGLRDNLKTLSQIVGEYDEFISDLTSRKIAMMKAIDEMFISDINGDIQHSIDEKEGLTVAYARMSDVLSKKIINRAYNLLGYYLSHEVLNKNVYGTAKLNKEHDTFNKEMGIAVAEKKMYSNMLGVLIGELKQLKQVILEEAFRAQQSVLEVERTQ